MGAGGSRQTVSPYLAPSKKVLGRSSEGKGRLSMRETSAELKHLLEAARKEITRKDEEIEAQRMEVASLQWKVASLEAGEDDDMNKWGMNGSNRLMELMNACGSAQATDERNHMKSSEKDVLPLGKRKHKMNDRQSLARRVSVVVGTNMGGNGGSSGKDHGHKSIVGSQIRSPARIAKQLDMYRRGTSSSSAFVGKPPSGLCGDDLSPVVQRLPRGGVYVFTNAGPVQFGIPPETVKDSMNLGLEVPTTFVVPRDRFNMNIGVNVSEIEFPAFFNFFVRRKQLRLVTHESCWEDLHTIMKEALDGPDKHQLHIDEEYSRFASDEILAAKPEHMKEMDYFREPRPGTPAIKVENLIKFSFFDKKGECDLGDGVVIKDDMYGFSIHENRAVTAVIPDEEARSCFLPNEEKADDEGEENAKCDAAADAEEVPREHFKIPRFGLTILGNSHGFDPLGSTSGFVIWINGQGIMVDPPPFSGELLKKSGIQPKLITATILTHCHADHDAGTIQKVITEDKVTLMTTKTIFNSLLRKYAGVAGLATGFLKQLVDFRPVFVEEPTYWGGACFRFFYSLHAIPCVGFEVSFEGKRIVYSADTYYDPEGLKAIAARGILSEKRCQALLNFPWDADIVLHESGVPPIHTPLSAFDSVPEAFRKNIQLIHIGTGDQKAALEKGLRVAKPGVENTTVLSPSTDTQETLRFLQLVASVDIFRGFPISQALELLLMSKTLSFAPGEVIAKKGTPGDKFMIILSGEASVSFGTTKKYFKVGDYLGEISVITGEERTGTIVAETPCSIVAVDKYAFHYFLAKDKKLFTKMECLVKSRKDGSWHAIARNSILRHLSAAQKTSLQAFLHLEEFSANQRVWKKGDVPKGAVLLLNGEFILEEVHKADPYRLPTATRHPNQRSNKRKNDLADVEFAPLTTGALICDMLAMTSKSPLTVTLTCASEKGVLFFISVENMLGFLDANPMILLALLKTVIIL